MDDVRPAAPATRRTALLALALLASTGLSALTPATAASSAPLVEVVVTSTTAGVAAAADAVRAAGGTVRDALPLVGGVSAELPEGAVLAPAFRVVADYPITLSSKAVASKDRAASPVREALGLSGPVAGGSGITIAVVDTGVAEVADLKGRLTHVDVSGSWSTGESYDPYGHGTFVAGVAAGDGASSQGRYAGVAPQAEVLDVRVAADDGSTDLATVLRGLEEAKAADVVNLSMSSGSPLPYQLDPLTTALSRLVELGKVVVVPSGNDGPGSRSVTSPGVDPRLLTVGSLDEQVTPERADDTVAMFSGRGPAPQGVAKPDLVAPGQSLVSLASPGSTVARENPDSAVGEGYLRGSGTSFSTAVVAGTAALLLEQGRKLTPPRALTPNQIKGLLMASTYDAAGLADLQAAGAGGLDVAKALVTPPVKATTVDPDVPPAGEEAVWHAFLQALLDGERAAAANSWSELSPAAHRWAAHRWAALGPEAHRWAANSWSAHRWAGADGSAVDWQMRLWAAHRWAAHRWATDDFVAHRWAEQEYVAHRWADVDGEAHRWAAHRWAAHRWAASRWAGSWS